MANLVYNALINVQNKIKPPVPAGNGEEEKMNTLKVNQKIIIKQGGLEICVKPHMASRWNIKIHWTFPTDIRPLCFRTTDPDNETIGVWGIHLRDLRYHPEHDTWFTNTPNMGRVGRTSIREWGGYETKLMPGEKYLTLLELANGKF